MKRGLSLFLLAAVLLTGCWGNKNTANLEATVSLGTVAPSATTVPAVPSVPNEPPVPPDPVAVYLSTMTLEEKVGQLFVVAPEQLMDKYSAVTQMTEKLKAGLAEYPVGGIILFGENIQSPAQLDELTRQFQKAADIALFVAVDEEGGRVARLAQNNEFGLPKYESAAAVGATGDPQNAHVMGETIGAYLAKYGFNLNFAPVADVNTNPNNTVIGTRAFSSDPVVAGKMASAFASGLGQKGVIATFKHFPGHGDTAEDSHSSLAVNHKDRAALEKCEWLPFLNATSRDMVMVGHIALPAVTGNMIPATMSQEIVTQILKEDLGFSGLVVTDSLQMDAITDSYDAGEAAITALKAGCDIILMPNDLPSAFAAVLNAVEDGTLSAQWLDNTVERILKFKQLHGILAVSAD